MTARISRRSWLLAAPALVLSATPRLVHAADWKKVGDKKGVVVFEREIAGAELPLFRGEAMVDADVLDILAVIHDVPRQTQWCHNTVESRLIAQEGPLSQVVYQRVEAPLGMADRDVVMRSTFHIASDQRKALASFRDTFHSSAPRMDGVIRMPKLEGEFALSSVGPRRTKVVYRVHSDPGGRLPSWMAIHGIRKIPLETLLGLQRQVANTRGRYRAIVERWTSSSIGATLGEEP